MSATLLQNWDPDASILMPEQRPHEAIQDAVRFGPNLTIAKGVIVGRKTSDQLMYAYSNTPSVGEVQVLTGTGTISGGTFTLSFSRGGAARVTSAIAYSANAAAVQAALEALDNVGAGFVTVSGGPIASAPFTITFGFAENVPQLVVDGASLTGSGATITPTTTTAGTTAVTGIETASAINMISLKTDANSKVFYGGSTTASVDNPPSTTSPVWLKGTFDPAKLTGLDAAARVDLKAKTEPNGLVTIG